MELVLEMKFYFYHKSAVSRFLIGWCAVTKRSPHNGDDTINSCLLALLLSIVVKKKKIDNGFPWCGLLITSIYIITWSKCVAHSLGCTSWAWIHNILTMWWRKSWESTPRKTIVNLLTRVAWPWRRTLTNWEWRQVHIPALLSTAKCVLSNQHLTLVCLNFQRLTKSQKCWGCL